MLDEREALVVRDGLQPGGHGTAAVRSSAGAL
jgi:hypothetical protein